MEAYIAVSMVGGFVVLTIILKGVHIVLAVIIKGRIFEFDHDGVDVELDHSAPDATFRSFSDNWDFGMLIAYKYI